MSITVVLWYNTIVRVPGIRCVRAKKISAEVFPVRKTTVSVNDRFVTSMPEFGKGMGKIKAVFKGQINRSCC